MKRAEPKDQQQQQTRTQRRDDFKARPQPRINAGAIVRRILYFVVVIATFPIRVIQWLTVPPGSAILFGAGAVYMLMLSIESYAQSGGLPVGFLPKFGISDGAGLGNLPATLASAIFYVSIAVSLIINSIQAWLLRDVSPDLAKQQFEAVQHHTVPKKNDCAIDIVEVRRKRYISSGTRTDRIKGAVLLFTYAIDIVVSYGNYPLLGLPVGRMLVNLVYFLFSLFGSEAFINLFRDAIDEARFQPHTEVV